MTFLEKYGDLRLRWMIVTIDGFSPNVSTVDDFLVDNDINWDHAVGDVEPWLTEMLDGLLANGHAKVDVPIGGGSSIVEVRMLP